jgi:hypothetical protein
MIRIFIIICLNCFGKSARGDGYIYPDKIIHNKDDLFFNSKESIKLKVLTAQNDIEKMEVISKIRDAACSLSNCPPYSI